tara:strand:- start:24 stop:281 length:258 start_codon:yes stop_codon:yes gene_type:complete
MKLIDNPEWKALDKREDNLIHEGNSMIWDILRKLDYLIEVDFDSDTLKTKIINLVKSHDKIRDELYTVRDQMDFLEKCEKEGYKK